MKAVSSFFRRGNARQKISELEREVERLREYNAVLSSAVAKSTRARDVLLQGNGRLCDQSEIGTVASVDEAFAECKVFVETAGAVMIDAVTRFNMQIEFITDLDGYSPQELTLAQSRVLDLWEEYLKHARFLSDSDALRSIHLNARTAERIAEAVREGTFRADRVGNHLKVIK